MKTNTKLISGIVIAALLAVAVLALAIRSRLVGSLPAIGTVERLVARFERSHAGRIWYINRYDLGTGRMVDVLIRWPPTNGTTRILFAKSATHTNRVWAFYEARQFVGVSNGEWFTTNVPVLTMPEFTETPDEIAAQAKKSP